MEKAGADVVVSPYLIGARHMYGRMFHPHATEFMELQMTDTEGNIRVHEREVPTSLQNVQVSSLNLSELRQTLLIAVKEGTHYHFKPEGSFTLRPGHVLIFLASNKDWARLQDQFADYNV
jgi:voltage-gated potassium channel